MKVSVIIPIYNVSLYVERCLRSVLEQSYAQLEIVIVNDKTEDNSMEIVRDVITRHGKGREIIIVEHERNRGLSASRNTGISHSSGEYIFFCDSDDELPLNSIAKLASKTHLNPDMVVGDYELKGTTLPFPLLETPTCQLSNRKEIMKLFMRSKIYPMAWNKLVRKDFVVSNNLYFKEGQFHEDRLWTFQCACCINSLAVVKEHTYIYYVRENSIMTSAKVENDFREYLNMLESMISYVETNNLSSNREVFSFIEEEKYFLAYMFLIKHKLDEELLDAYFQIMYHQPAALYKIFLWGIVHKSYRMRDAHYFLPFHLRRAYYRSLARTGCKWRYSDKKLMKSFNKWYIGIICNNISWNHILKPTLFNFEKHMNGHEN